MTDYKNYSLNNLRDSIQDCVISDARPHEIYDTIRNTIIETIFYHETCLRDSKELLSLLSGSEGLSIENIWDKIDRSRITENNPTIFDRWRAEDQYNKKIKENK
tara:strand:- start:606 stop:917 length:312 start_codon:yes stop_codon:yes gene_type:complete